MRRLTLLLTLSCSAVCLSAHVDDRDAKISPLNQRILSFCRQSLGKKVGDGQCADLAYQAMLAAGAESPDDFKDDPKPGDYVWGQLEYGYRVEHGRVFERGDRNAVQPGDIVQMRDVVIDHEEDGDDYITHETIDADHHTAIVAKVQPDRLTYEIIEQNANEVPQVTNGSLPLRDMKQGYLLVYRALPDPGDNEDPDRQLNLQGHAQSVHRQTARARSMRKPHHSRRSHGSRHARRHSSRG